ncbi:rubrerythrin [Nitrobacteraceae bacterium AZCC 1564]
MAGADLDVVIRRVAKEQNKSLVAATKERRDHYLQLAAKAKTKEAKDQYKQLAKDAMEHGSAAAKRLQMSADNVADSYARAMRRAIEDAAPKPVAAAPAKQDKPAKPVKAAKPAKTPANKTPKKTAKKAKKAKS